MENLQPYFQEMRRVIAARGWIQGDLETPQGVCLIGAIDIVVINRLDEPLLDIDLHDALVETLAGAIPARRVCPAGSHAEAIMSWNDAASRTYTEVDQLLARLAPVPLDVVDAVAEEAMVCA